MSKRSERPVLGSDIFESWEMSSQSYYTYRFENSRRAAVWLDDQRYAQMWIVRVALSRPYTFIVLALLILILSPVVILRTPTDIFPNIDIPVIAVAWTYTGL